MSGVCEESSDLTPGIFGRTSSTELRIRIYGFKKRGSGEEASASTTGIGLVSNPVKECISDDVWDRSIARGGSWKTRALLAARTTIVVASATVAVPATTLVWAAATTLAGNPTRHGCSQQCS